MRRAELIVKNCKTCDGTFSRVPWLAKVSNFCSKECRYESARVYRINKCEKCDIDFVPASSTKGRFCSIECYWDSTVRRDSHRCMDCDSQISPAKGVKRCRSCISKHMSGSNHWAWKEDRNSLKKENRHGDSAYREWRKEVWLRDNFKCKIANPDCAGRIEAHHILVWSEYPELRYQTNNGITLCHAHHPRKRAEEKRLVPVFQELVSVSSKTSCL